MMFLRAHWLILFSLCVTLTCFAGYATAHGNLPWLLSAPISFAAGVLAREAASWLPKRIGPTPAQFRADRKARQGKGLL
jgi:hypothetical protein